MVRSTLLLTLATAVSTAFGIEKVGTNKAGSSRVPGAYIFEFEDDHVCAHIMSYQFN